MMSPNLDEHQDCLWCLQPKQMPGPFLPDRMVQKLEINKRKQFPRCFSATIVPSLNKCFSNSNMHREYPGHLAKI